MNITNTNTVKTRDDLCAIANVCSFKTSVDNLNSSDSMEQVPDAIHPCLLISLALALELNQTFPCTDSEIVLFCVVFRFFSILQV